MATKINNRCILIVILLFAYSNSAKELNMCEEWDPFKDELCFKVLNTENQQSYEDAKNACKQFEGSHLITIKSIEEQTFLHNFLRNVKNISNYVWIGAQYINFSIKWSDDSIDTTFTYWAKHNPVNTSETQCILMSPTNNGEWITDRCELKSAVVCQRDQMWYYPYLQATVMQLRLTIESVTKQLQSTETRLKQEIENKIAAESIPAGTVAFFARMTVPTGWLKANGENVSRVIYQRLFSVINTTFGAGNGATTFTLPDLRGEFLRAWSDGRSGGADSDRQFGSFQFGSNIPFVGKINDTNIYTMSPTYGSNWVFSGTTFDGGFEANIAAGDTRQGTVLPSNMTGDDFAASRVGTNVINYDWNRISTWNMLKGTRPRNIALLACIKY